jgi:hypothetical protein
LARLQNALRKTLEEEHERVHLQLKEKEAKFKRLEKDKEEVGVRLYGVQQNLAEMQLHFEQTHENYNLIQKLRYNNCYYLIAESKPNKSSPS